ncbi:hypothetical protein RFH42_10975 [Acinetobacter rudis]|uniref:hypothetical protein n=1 Tax=Acinetobacter rudis TaxID=632955 RepID=UPI00280D159C|nr:hypothetical protein [Acinetobacter rudis]MDQ8953482.1 hypothetical protein [Acinetobacter rudis]
MAKKNLSEKIKIAVTWFVGLTCLYFVVAAWLNSDGPNFNPTLTYNLIKDTLTLAAAFLAPIAAFVLFSDWREQFVAQVKHRVLTQMYDIHFKLLRKLSYARAELTNSFSSDHDSEAESIFLMRKEFDNNIQEIRRLCGNSEFTQKSQQASAKFKKLADLLSEIESYKKNFPSRGGIQSNSNSLTKVQEDEFDMIFKTLELDLENMDSWDNDKTSQ